MTSPLLKLREASDNLSPTERAVAEQILRTPELVTQLSIHELAKRTFSSSATIVRLCSHIGYSGYRAFRQAVSQELAVRSQLHKSQEKQIEPMDTVEQIMEKITYRNILSLEQTRALLDPDILQKCVELIQNARVIYLFGIGASFCAAKDLYLKLLRIDKITILNEDWHSQLIQARNATPQDVGIIFSYSGATVEMIDCLKAMKENGVPTIAMTRFVKSPISTLVDHKLYIAANEALFRSGAMASRISQLNTVDILYTCLANQEYEHALNQMSRTYIQKPGDQ